MRRTFRVLALVMLVSAVVPAQTSKPAAPAAKSTIPYAEAKPLLETFRDDLPAELKAKSPAELESAWPGWVSRHNAEIRARLERGDEDSIVNLWLFGTTFTKRPRADVRDVETLGGPVASDIIQQRLEDLVAGIASPGTNERLQFARQVVERKAINPATEAGRDQLRLYLRESRRRVFAELEAYVRIRGSAALLNDQGAQVIANSTVFRDRGLSSDTSILPNFGIEQALTAMMSQRAFGAGSVRRVAIVGPGLDFTEQEGHDFYPQQTIQPFAVIDSLIRFGLAAADDLRVTTFDVSPRINQHLEAARQRARRGGAYVLHLPLNGDERWNADLLKYWERFGDRIGDEMEPVAVPPVAGRVDIRAVRVRPSVVLPVVPQDLNIVLERLEPLDADDRFDLIVATNILVYYGPFEQALAVANVAKMLRPRGFFLSNNAVFPTPPMDSSVSFITVAYSGRPDDGDTIFWYRHE